MGIRTLPRFALPLVSCVVFAAASPAQSTQSYLNDTGATAYGVQIPVENGYIDISNGNLHLAFPLAGPPQRGALGVNESLVYDSRIWMFSPFGSKGSYHWWPQNVYGASSSAAGWRLVTGGETGSIGYNYLSSSTQQCQWPQYGGAVTTTVNQIVWTDAGGSVHPFSARSTQVNSTCPYQNTPPSTTVTGGQATDGSGYSIPGPDASGNPIVRDNNGTQVYPTVIDRYGNYLSTDGSGNLIDTTGRVPVIATQNGNVTTYDVLAPNGTINNQGTRVRYTVTTTSINVATDFVPWQNSDIHQWSGTLYPVQSIGLPDGSQYSFGYDADGELNFVTLPTGGTISYAYANFFDSSNTENRLLTSRTVGSGTATAYTPSVVATCVNYSNGCVEHVTVHKPSGDETVYELTLNNGAWNTGTSVYTGSAASGQKLLQTTSTDTYTNPCQGTSGCYGANYVSLSTNTKTVYGAQAVSSQTQSVLNPSVGKVSTVKEWDYGASVTGTPTRETDYTYTGLDVQQVNVLSNGTQAGQTNYAYTTNATATSGIAQHGTQNAGGPYLQTVSHVLTGGNPAATNYGMDDTGQVVSTSDPNGNPASTVSYQCANSLPYQTKNPLGQTTQYGYDCNSGAVKSVQDPNDLANNRAGTTYAYESGAGRPQSVTYPDGGKTSYTYPSFTEVDTTVLATPNPSLASRDLVDGFGRKYQHIQAGVVSGTTYDVNGRVNCVSNPNFTSGAGSTTDGATCITAYDGLDRPVTQQQPDGATLQWSYNGATTTSTDETGKQWQRTSDSFGHLVKVVEPSYWTTQYAYDGLGNLQKIAQGDGVNRTFVHDSLGRLTNECHPEAIAAGQTCSLTGPWSSSFVYDANGNATDRTDARGVTVHSTYDALNRLTHMQPTAIPQPQNGTPITGFDSYFVYDLSNWAGNPSANSIGRLVGTSNNVDAAQAYSYDAMGRLVRQGNYTPSVQEYVSQIIGAGYDLAGNLTSLTYPDGRTVKQAFQSDGLLHSVVYDNWNGQTVGYPYLSSANYYPNGSSQSMTFGNNVVQSYTRNNRLQPIETKVALGSTVYLDKQFCYGPTTDPNAPFCTVAAGANNGNVQQVLDAQNNANTQGFSYNSNNGLVSFSNGSGSMQQSFGINAYGNMTPVVNGNPVNTADPVNYRINNLPCASSLPAFDNAGNQLCDTDPNGANRIYAYKANGLVSGVTMQNGNSPLVSYDYLPDNSRVRKSLATGAWTEYFYFSGQIIAEKNQTGTWADYIYANGQKIARATSSSTGDTTYFHGDQIGSVRVLTASNGSLLTSDTFLPFGQEPGGTAGTNHYQYAGLERDPETGLDHATFRQYSAALGRWMSPDPYDGSMDLGNPQSLNRYSYVGNNPLRYTDPKGLFGEEIFMIVNVFAAGGEIDPIQDVLAGVLVGADIVGEAIFGGAFAHPHITASTTPRPQLRTRISGGTSDPNSLDLPSGGSNNYFLPVGYAPNTGTPRNPCQKAGYAYSPQYYARQGIAAGQSGVLNATFTLGFYHGGPEDAQAFGSSFAYANYVFGVYMAAQGLSLSATLNVANTYGALFSHYTPRYLAQHPLDGTYGSIPSDNVSNITHGVQDLQNGTLCQVGH